MTMPRINSRACLVAVPAVLALGLTGCSSSTGGEPVAQGTATSSATGAAATSGAAPSNSCAPVSGKILTLVGKAAGEPTIGLPQPSGWDRETSMDSQLIRAAIVNKSLVAKGFAANAVVTMENAKGMSAQQALDSQMNSLRTGLKVKGLVSTPGTLCGYPMTTGTFTMPGDDPDHKATSMAVSVPDGPNMWSITVTVQSTMPDNATYQRDSQEILTGLQITK